MILTALLAAAAAPQHPIDATLDYVAPPVNLGGGLGTAATSGFDDFNRANSGDLGSGWTNWAGAIGIDANRASSLANLSLSTLNGVDDAYDTSSMSAYVESAGTGLFYVAMVAGFADSSNNVFVKVQDNDFDSLMDRVFFYYGNNGGSWGSTTYYYDLATPTRTCDMTLSFDNAGDRAVLTIDNHTSGSTEVFYGDNLLAFGTGGLGTGFGMGTFGQCYADDFSVNGGSGNPLDLTATGVPGTVMTFTTTGATPGGGVALIWAFNTGSFVIPNGFPCAGTTLGLDTPEDYVILSADGAGMASYTRWVPPAAAGLVHMQSLDVLTCGLSNILSL